MSIESRKDPRYDVEVPVVLAYGGKTFAATITNISLGGCMIVGDFQIPHDEVVKLEFEAGSQKGEFVAKVVWQTSHQGPGRIGVCFWEMEKTSTVEKVKSLIELAGKKEEPPAVVDP